MTPTKLTRQKDRVLREFLERPEEELHGYEVLRSVHMPSGTIYPMLAELERAGILKVRAAEHEGQRGPRRRHYYRLNPDAVPHVRQARAEAHRMWNGDRAPGEVLPQLGWAR